LALSPARMQEERQSHDAGASRDRQVPHKIPQLVPDRTAKPPVSGPSARAKKAAGKGRSPVFASGNGRAATRGSGEVIELEHGITVYLPVTNAAGGWRSGMRPGSGSSARRRPKRSWPPCWRKSRSGWRRTRRGCGSREPPSSPTT